jgi:hypothetical protein
MDSPVRRLLGLALVLAPLSVPLVAAAQAPAAGSAAPEPAPSAPAAGAGGATGAAPAASSSAAPKATGEPGGYSYTDKPVARPAHRHGVRRHVSGPVATLPGFEETNDGGSRLFVALTQQVPVEERKAAGSITYVLQGAHVTKRNNTNALVTVHFNTPVWRARLVPKGKDLLFVVDLRAATTPTWKMTEAPDHTALFTIDFPKGDYTNVAVPERTARRSKKAGKDPRGSAPPAPPPPATGAPDGANGAGSGPNP